MKCKLITQISEVVIRDYSLVEDEGLIHLADAFPELSHAYEEDEENPGRHMIVITAPDLNSILKFLDFVGLPVEILT